MKKDFLETKERDVNTYVSLYCASKFFLNNGVQKRSGCFYNFSASLTYVAFAFEAFINHIGSHVFSDWSEKDKTIKEQHKRIGAVLDELKINPDRSKRPWQTLSSLLKYRRKIAHGRSEKLYKENLITQATYEHNENDPLGDHFFISTEWEKYCTEKNAKRAIEDVTEIMIFIDKKARENHHFEYPLFNPGMQSGEIKKIGV